MEWRYEKMFALFRCRDCGFIFEYSPIRWYTLKYWKDMVERGLLDREAIRERGRIPIRFHPRYYHPICPMCGSHSDWWLRRRSVG